MLTALFLGAGTGVAQQAGTEEEATSEAETALNNLRNSRPFRRQDARRELVSVGQPAVQPLIDEVSGYKTIGDQNYVVNCIIALGDLGDPAATDVLLQTLQSHNEHISYQSGVALGKIWEEQQSSSRIAEVNAELLGVFYQSYPDMKGMGAAIGLSRINGFSFRPQDLSMDTDLRTRMEQWWTTGQADLPPLDAQPWPLLLRRVIVNQNNQARQQLISRKPLEAVDRIVRHLARPGSEVPQNVWQNLGNVLAQITGVEFPPSDAGQGAGRKEQVARWAQKWAVKLRQTTDKEHINYVWRKLEEKVQQLKMEPTDQLTGEIQGYREILLTQMASPDDIPPDASREVTRLLAEPLEVKQDIADSVAQLQQSVPDWQKLELLQDIKDSLTEPGGTEVAGQFIGRITALARKEKNKNVLALLGDVMSRISGIPCDLTSETVDRSQAMKDWLDKLQQNRPDLSAFVQA